MRCPECGHSNVPGSLFCERCGTDLEEQVGEPVEAADEAPVAGLACGVCGHVNDPRFGFCEACGSRLAPAAAAGGEAVAEPVAAPPRVEEPPPPIRRPEAPPPAPPPPSSYESSALLATGPQRGKVKLVVEQGMVIGKQFLLSEDEMLVGREDPSDNVYPDVDLSGLDEGYVHRRHARLAFEGSFLFVTHLGGHNKTYVNNRPIADGLAHPLNVGDTVRLGKVVLRLVEA